jgi:hypothetical protein
MRILKTYELYPDGVIISVNWDKMGVGTSAFIPCIDTAEAASQVRDLFKTRGWQCDTRVCVENNKLGVRFWRTL